MKSLQLTIASFFLVSYLVAGNEPGLNYSRTFLGGGFGFGVLRTVETLSVPTTYQNNIGECLVKQKVWTMCAQFATGVPEKSIGLSAIVAFELGGAPSKWYWNRATASSVYTEYQKAFDFFFNGRIGIGLTYVLPSRVAMVGVRYYNNYNADAMRSTFDNSDDAACIGIYGCVKSLTFDVGYGSDKIPGVLVNSDYWNYMTADLRWKFGTDEDYFSWYLGLRFEKSWFTSDALYDDSRIVGTQTVNSNFFLPSIGFGF